MSSCRVDVGSGVTAACPRGSVNSLMCLSRMEHNTSFGTADLGPGVAPVDSEACSG